nr:unnamed protein product [Callosobruchus analis]
MRTQFQQIQEISDKFEFLMPAKLLDNKFECDLSRVLEDIDRREFQMERKRLQQFPGILGLQGATLKSLDKNLGLMPIKLGTSKITKNEHSILYSFDVNLVISEVNKLKLKTEIVERLLRQNFEHYNHSANYLNMLYFLERKVDGKLNDIFPSTYETFPSFSIRIKRGLENGPGSIFKAITGNLNARDGERYESLISELQNNQNKVSEAINSQSTLSVELIDNFNKTISQVTHNQLVLENKIKKLSSCPTTCQEVDAVITEPMMKRLHDSRQWILLIPTETTITLRCEKGQEMTRVLGSYLVEIPTGCTLQLNEDWITNQEPVSIGNQPILFPNINVNISLSNPKNFTLQLDQVELDEIHKIRRRIIDNRVDVHSVKVSHIPSFWTIILYGVLLMIVCCFVYKKITPRCFKPKPRSIPKEEIDLSNVHLPRPEESEAEAAPVTQEVN